MNLSGSAVLRSSSHISEKPAYQVGDRDDRPWGHYVVTSIGTNADGEEYCEKIITVKPLQVLSLQSHDLRRETWTVKKGTLTALCGGRRLEALTRETLHIPAGAVHCMANLGEEDCVVVERQEGICREGDIRRYMDVYRRGTEGSDSPAVSAENFTAYRIILSDIKKIHANRMKGVPY
jgi:mannose-6-phosphate isomerase-like protein (cupin superfamily)